MYVCSLDTVTVGMIVSHILCDDDVDVDDDDDEEEEEEEDDDDDGDGDDGMLLILPDHLLHHT